MKVTTNMASGHTNSIGFFVKMRPIVCIVRFSQRIRLHAQVRRRVTLLCGEVCSFRS